MKQQSLMDYHGKSSIANAVTFQLFFCFKKRKRNELPNCMGQDSFLELDYDQDSASHGPEYDGS